MKGGGVYNTVVRPDRSMSSSTTKAGSNGMLIGQLGPATVQPRPRMGSTGMSSSTGLLNNMKFNKKDQ